MISDDEDPRNYDYTIPDAPDGYEGELTSFRERERIEREKNGEDYRTVYDYDDDFESFVGLVQSYRKEEKLYSQIKNEHLERAVRMLGERIDREAKELARFYVKGVYHEESGRYIPKDTEECEAGCYE